LQAYYKAGITREDGMTQMSLRALKETSYDEMNITFSEEATEEFDTYDTRKMFAFAGNAPQIYSKQYGEQLSLNSLPLLKDEGYDVKVGYKAGENGAQAIEANLVNLPETEVFLEDLLTGNMQNLTEQPVYKFYANVSDDPDRFVLHFNPVVTGIEKPVDENLVFIYAFDDKIAIRSTGASAKEDKEVWVYDMFGRTAIHTTAPASDITTIPANRLKGYVVVEVISESGVTINKVYIK
jgi:hypothetical protein